MREQSVVCDVFFASNCGLLLSRVPFDGGALSSKRFHVVIFYLL